MTHPSLKYSRPASAANEGIAMLDPAEVTFRDVYGAAVPASSAGPHVIDPDGQVSGFDHTPAGAVEAAASLTYSANSAQPLSTIQATVAQQVVGPDQPAFLAHLEQQQAAGGPSASQIAASRASGFGVWAYEVRSYTPSMAQVDLLVRASTAGDVTYVNFATATQWWAGDWRLVAPPGGDWGNVASTVPSVPAGYTVIGRAR
jgi:hypothetical protein